MAKSVKIGSFNFGANRKPAKSTGKKSTTTTHKGGGNKANSWRRYNAGGKGGDF